MVVALVILTLIVCLAVDMVGQRRPANGGVSAAAGRPAKSTRIQSRLLHPGHGWAMVEELGKVRLGVDELAGRLIGTPERVDVPPAGTEVRQGEPLVTLRRRGRALTVASALTGMVVESNSELKSEPGLVRTSPQEKGWIVRIIPARFDEELRNLLRGESAERWRKAAEAQVRSWFSLGLGTVLQDGGAWVDNIGDQVTDEDWDRMARELFPVSST